MGPERKWGGHVLSLRGVKPGELTYRYANFDDVAFIGKTMRDADRLEIGASCPGLSPGEVLAYSMGVSSWRCWVAQPRHHYGPPVCIVGVADMGNGVGAPWLLGTAECQTYRRDILRMGRGAVREFHKMFPVLSNTIDTNNTMHVRWVKALGFRLHDDGERFQQFERRTEEDV